MPNKLSRYLSLIKFSHTIFAIPFALIGFFLAIKLNTVSFDWKTLGYILLCMIFARNAAMGFNRYIDRHIDKKNPRTAIREIPAGAIKERSALWFVILNSLLFIITTYFINTLTLFLSPVALAVILGYSLTKRFTAICHFILGLGLSLAPIGAYLAVTARFDVIPLLFSSVVLLWVSGFDIIYALQDEEFDKYEKLKSIPVFLGKKGALLLSSILHLFVSILVVLSGIIADFEFWYWIGALIFIGLLFYQHTLVKPNDLSRVNMAFFTTNGVASILFAVFVLLELHF